MKPATLDDNSKATLLSLQIYDLEKNLYRDGKDLAKSLTADFLYDIRDICIENFLGNVEYTLAEMEFIEEIARKFDIKIKNDVPETLRNMTEDEVCERYTDVTVFNWKEKRYYTEEELKIRREKAHELAMKIIDKMEKDREFVASSMESGPLTDPK